MAKARKPAIVLDLDGTLTDYTHRAHLLAPPKNWDAFFEAMGGDDPYKWCLELAEHFAAAGYEIVLLTGRPDKYRTITEDWLRDHNVPYKVLLMRDSADFRPGAEIKAEIYRNEIEPYYDVLLAVDDNPNIARMWEQLGIRCLYCGDLASGDDPTL